MSAVPAVNPRVHDGSIVCYRLVDVCDEVKLDEAERILSISPRARVGRREGTTMDFVAVPLLLELPKRTLKLKQRSIDVSASLHLFAHGALSVAFRIPIEPGTSLETMAPLLQELYGSEVLDQEARKEVDAATKTIAKAISGAHDWRGIENFTILQIKSLEGAVGPRELLAWKGLAKLVVGETGAHELSERHRREVLEYAFGYRDDDLVVIDWNSALVIDPEGGADVMEVLEYANSQLLNLRYYDAQLDYELSRIQSALAHDSGGYFRSPYAKLAHQVFRRLLGLSELVERVDNSIKVVGDFYLARVYRAALARLRVSVWTASIERKHGLVSDAYTMLKGEVELKRGLALEIMVVFLIVIEVVLALKGGH